MKYVKFLFSLWLMLSLCSARGQTYSIEVNSGIGTFSMHDLKKLLQYQNQGNDVPTAIVHNYPSYLVFDVKGLLHKEDVWLGIDCKYMSSGGRISYRDYSGELRLDHLVSAIAVGGSVKKQLYQQKRFSFCLMSDLVIVQTFLEQKSYIAIYDQSDSESLRTVSTGIGIEPAVNISYKLGRFSTGLNVGYFANANASFHLSGNPEAILTNNEDRSKVSPNWSGFRSSVKIGFTIK